MRTRRRHGLALLAWSALVLPGCLTSDTLIKVRADGSGTLEQTIMVNPKTFQSFAAMAGPMLGGADGKAGPPELPSPTEMLDEVKLKEAAARFGRGVRYVSSAPVTSGDLEGARAVFAFDDINMLNVSQDPAPGGARSRDPIRFRLDRTDEGSVLVVTMRVPDRTATTDQPQDTPSAPQVPPDALALIKPMLQGLHLAVAIDVEGRLVRTNADHVQGNRVTLLDLDFGPLLDSPSTFEKLTAVRPGAPMGQMASTLKGLPGVKVNASPTVSIAFR